MSDTTVSPTTSHEDDRIESLISRGVAHLRQVSDAGLVLTPNDIGVVQEALRKALHDTPHVCPFCLCVEEDVMDLEAAREAMKEPGRITLVDLKRKLDL